MVAERQIVAFGPQGRQARTVPLEEIRQPVSYLLTVQKSDGSFTDPDEVIHRGVLVTYFKSYSMLCTRSVLEEDTN